MPAGWLCQTLISAFWDGVTPQTPGLTWLHWLCLGLGWHSLPSGALFLSLHHLKPRPAFFPLLVV